MSIIFYSMPGCGYCVKAKKMFAEEIASGEIVEKPSSEAPKNARGFPTFMVAATGEMHSGLPNNKKELYTILGLTEKYEDPRRSFWGVGVY